MMGELFGGCVEVSMSGVPLCGVFLDFYFGDPLGFGRSFRLLAQTSIVGRHGERLNWTFALDSIGNWAQIESERVIRSRLTGQRHFLLRG